MPGDSGRAPIVWLPLDALTTDPRLQLRVRLDEEAIQRYVDAMARRSWFPALECFYDGANYYLADGYHRLEAARRVGWTKIRVRARGGTFRDAVLFSAGANDRHGLPRTAADKRKAVLTLLGDPEWVKWSNRAIARQCNVSSKFVDNLRAEMRQLDGSVTPARYVRRGKQVYTMRMSSPAAVQRARIKVNKKGAPYNAENGQILPAGTVEEAVMTLDAYKSMSRELLEAENEALRARVAELESEVARLQEILAGSGN